MPINLNGTTLDDLIGQHIVLYKHEDFKQRRTGMLGQEFDWWPWQEFFGIPAKVLASELPYFLLVQFARENEPSALDLTSVMCRLISPEYYRQYMGWRKPPRPACFDEDYGPCESNPDDDSPFTSPYPDSDDECSDE